MPKVGRKLRVGCEAFPGIDKSEQLCEASFVVITNRRVTVRFDPFGMLGSERDANQLL